MEAEGKINVLIVDDRPENLTALESVLGELKIRIVRADSGEHALRAVLKQDFAVILLDVQMPGMDGFETATLIRQRERSAHTPIIFITAIERSEERVFEGYQSGAVDYIFKPFNPDILRAKVSVFVDLWSVRQALAESEASLRHINATLEEMVAQRTKELVKSEAKYRQLVESMHEIFFVGELEKDFTAGRLSFVSPQVESILGIPAEDYIKEASVWLRYIHPVDFPAFTEVTREAMREGKPVTCTYRHHNPRSGEYRWLEDSLFPQFADDGRVVAYFGVARDVTERKQAEQELLKLREAVDTSGEVIFMTDREGVITFVNPEFTRLYGFTAAEVVGKSTPRILKGGAMKPEDYAHFWETLLNKQVVKGELINKTKDGRLLNIEASVNPILDERQEIVGFLAIQRDITERKQAEEQIQRQVETLGSLYDLSRTLAEMEDFNAILDLLARRAVEVTRVTFARVLLLEQDDLVVRSAFPLRVLGHDLQVGQREPLAAHPLCQRVLEENIPRVLQLGSPEAGDCAPLFLDIAQTLCVIPLRTRERPLGLLMLGEVRDMAREPFTADKIHLAVSIGDQAASTLYRSLLHDQTRRRLQRIQALHAIDEAISGSVDMGLTLSMTLEQVVIELNVDAAAVLLLNPHTQTLEYAAGRGFRGKAIERSRLRLGEGFSGGAALDRRVVSVHHLRTDLSAFGQADRLAGEDFECYHSAPLITKGQVKGVLEVFLRSHRTVDAEWLDFLETLAGQVAIAVDSASLFADLQHSTAELFNAYDSTIEGWSKALDLRDKETEGHTQRVTEMTLKLARAAGMTEEELVHVRRGGLLHDIGKMGVPDSILLKPGKLTDEEWVAMRKHPTFAFELLTPIAYLRPALDIPYCHHEKWDGTGYPRGLKGEQIPLAARLFAIVDVWDALRSDRPYRKAWPEAKVLEHIQAGSGTHFDPQAVDLFLKVMNESTKGAG